MEFSSITIRNIAYGVLGLLALFIMLNSFNIKNSMINSVFGVGNYSVYENNSDSYYKSQPQPIREGFLFDTGNKDSDKQEEERLDECINRKLNSLKVELGGSSGITEIKRTLTKAREACNYEASKCMMNLLSSNRNTKTINLEKLLDDPENRDCTKYKDYTGLSTQLTQLIDNL
tara:strand:+ start:954 stop:1475 length:522 start_codon:yes stop_codon:yes gene_type:complete